MGLVNCRMRTYASASGTLMELNSISAALWQVSIIVKVLFVLFLFLARAYPSRPFFTTYAIVLSLRSITLWVITQAGSYALYFYTFWASQAVLVSLALTVVWEIYRDTLAVFPSLRRWTSPSLAAGLVALLLLSIWSVVGGPGNLPSGIVASLVLLERSIWGVQTGLLLLLLAAASLAGLSIRTPSFGIALGLGLHSATELAMLALITAKGETVGNIQVVGGQIGFLIAVTVWTIFIGAFGRQESAHPSPDDTALLKAGALSQILQRD